jgi:hypothetical protein
MNMTSTLSKAAANMISPPSLDLSARVEKMGNPRTKTNQGRPTTARNFFLDDVRIVLVSPNARADHDHEKEKITGHNDAVKEAVGKHVSYDHGFLSPFLIDSIL